MLVITSYDTTPANNTALRRSFRQNHTLWLQFLETILFPANYTVPNYPFCGKVYFAIEFLLVVHFSLDAFKPTKGPNTVHKSKGMKHDRLLFVVFACREIRK